jgi:hypothetical protein
LTCAFLVAWAAGCGDGGDSEGVSANPYRADLEEARSQATSDLERDVLDDLEIERHEYEEAVDAYVSCMRGRGVTIETHDQSGYYIYETVGIVEESVKAQCRVGTIDLIEGLYVDQLMNPDRLDINVVIRTCLVRHDVVDDSYSVDDLSRDLEDGFTAAPFAADDERLDGCLANPSR